MKAINLILSGLILSTLLIFTTPESRASADIYPPISKNPTSISQQVQNYLQGISTNGLDEEKKVLVDFILNSKGEILILSTSNRRLDDAIKQKLNYKQLKNHSLQLNKTYTFPILFRN